MALHEWFVGGLLTWMHVNAAVPCSNSACTCTNESERSWDGNVPHFAMHPYVRAGDSTQFCRLHPVKRQPGCPDPFMIWRFLCWAWTICARHCKTLTLANTHSLYILQKSSNAWGCVHSYSPLTCHMRRKKIWPRQLIRILEVLDQLHGCQRS